MSRTTFRPVAVRLFLVLLTASIASSGSPVRPSGAPMAPGVGARGLDLEKRVEYQRRIERVHWNHRIWPEQSPRAKPSLDEVLPPSRLHASVEDYLKKSSALGALWGRSITAAQLQAEMDRMAAQSRAPAVLRELFAALDDDPFVIAETLARQALADRLIRDWYARDERFHGELRRTAEAALAGASSGLELPALGAEYTETTWRLRNGTGTDRVPAVREIELDAQEWHARVAGLARLLGSDGESLDALPLMTLSGLEESDDAFFVVSVIEKDAGSLIAATASWPKKPFDEWWREQIAVTSLDDPTPSSAFDLPRLQVDGGCVPDTWGDWTSSPASRSLHSAVWTGSEMIVWGGFGVGGLPLNSGGRYDPATDTWVMVTTGGAPAPRGTHLAVWTGSEMIVWGGAGLNEEVVKTGGRYDPQTDIWVATTNVDAPAARWKPTAVWTGSEMIVWGGTGIGGNYDTGARYDPSIDRWTETSTDAAPSPRYEHSAVWTGREMIVWGGIGGPAGNSALNSGGSYNPSRDEWSSMSTSALDPTPRYSHTAVWTGRMMVIWGGRDGSTFFDTGGSYNPSNDHWSATTTTGAPAARASQAAVWANDEMIVWGGWNGAYLSTGGSYDPVADGWASLATTDAPAARDGHTAIWTGSEMIVWGGSGPTNSGGRYAPASDSWVAMATGGVAPSARDSHTAVWTGSEMIVWGGYGDSQALSTGGRFNPATNDWTPTQTIGAPTARAAHTAVWTGSEMIVWGGGTYIAEANTGGRYDPTADAWAPTTTQDAPTHRRDHTSVWTGNEMVVWGGFFSSSGIYWITGARYDPVPDHWTPTTTDGAPSFRYAHSAVWTGDEMIIWGGDLAGPPYTGARYDPFTDHWTPMSTAGAPAAVSSIWAGNEMIVWGGGGGGRYDPSSDHWTPMSTAGAPTSRGARVWTGHEMVVWGGETTYLDTGGRYDPATDSWSATATEGAPTARESHTAVWTGDEMIVWGGRGALGRTDSGGRYCVASCDSPSAWYLDRDGDGYGTPALVQYACDPPEGFGMAGDCDDTVATCNTDCESDVDGDFTRDCEDNCASVPNVLQLDSDSDLVGDACDCDPADPANPTVLGPAVVRFTSKTELAWDAPEYGGSGGLTYDFLRAVDAADWQEVLCLETGIPGTTSVDDAVPAVAFYYLIRVTGDCGSNTGTASGEQRRELAVCEEGLRATAR